MSQRVRTRDRFKLSVSVFIFFVQDNKLLLVLRSNTGWLDGHYSVPGGVKEPQETLVAAAIREAQEEIGAKVEMGDVALVHLMHNFTTGQEWIGAFFLANRLVGKPKIKEPHKHSKLRWALLNNLPKNTAPYVRQAIDNYQKKILYSEFGWNIPKDADEKWYDYQHSKIHI